MHNICLTIVFLCPIDFIKNIFVFCVLGDSGKKSQQYLIDVEDSSDKGFNTILDFKNYIPK